MKNTKQRLTLTQENLMLLTHEQKDSGVKNVGTTTPLCPNCSYALTDKQTKQ